MKRSDTPPPPPPPPHRIAGNRSRRAEDTEKTAVVQTDHSDC